MAIPKYISPKICHLFALYAAIILCLCYGASLLASLHWVFDLFSSFVLQYILASLLLLWVFLLCRKPRLATLMFVVLLLNASEYLPDYRPGEYPSGSKITLAQFNKHGRVENLKPLNSWLAEKPADIVILQEVRNKDVTHIGNNNSLETIYPYRFPSQREKNLDIYILSAYPITSGEILKLDTPLGPTLALRVLISPPSLPSINLYSVHTARPLPRSENILRNAQLSSIARIFADDSAHHKIIAGDLNITPWSPVFKKFLKDAGITNHRVRLIQPTSWPSYFATPLLQIPIDHILAGGYSRVAFTRSGPFLASDHRPLIASVTLASSDTTRP